MNIAKGISDLKMLDSNCPKCMEKDKKPVKLFNLEFDKKIVNDEMAFLLKEKNKTAGNFCLNTNCDPKYRELSGVTGKLPNKQTQNAFGGSAAQS